jgi:hypothetical protein
VANVVAASVSRESGDLLSQPLTVPGEYWIYYLPFRTACAPDVAQYEIHRGTLPGFTPGANTLAGIVRSDDIPPRSGGYGESKLLYKVGEYDHATFTDKHEPGQLPLGLVPARRDPEAVIQLAACSRGLDAQVQLPEVSRQAAQKDRPFALVPATKERRGSTAGSSHLPWRRGAGRG